MIPAIGEREKLDLQRTASKELCFHLIKKTGLNSRLLAIGCDDILFYAQARLTSKMTSQRGLGIHVGSGISALKHNKATRIFLEKTTSCRF